MDKKYTVLMSVYKNERPEYLRAAIDTMIAQTLQANEFILVCDGPLTNELENILKEFEDKLKIVRLKRNLGLGGALSEGLRYCTNEWVVRMDSDDLAILDRCELQLKYIETHPEIDVLSGTIAEFTGEALNIDDAMKSVKRFKRVPIGFKKIQRDIQYRNPMNHPCVIFRKAKVLQSGGYCPCNMFEDYDLWVRMLINDCVLENLSETLVYMRVSDMHKRRGGLSYARAVLQFQNKMYSRNVINFPQYIFNVVSRVGMSLLPVQLRKMIYNAKLRSSE